MVEIFVVAPEKKVFRCLLPDGNKIDEDEDLSILKEYLDYEAKIVFYPSRLAENTSKGEVDIEVWDELVDLINNYSILFPGVN